MKVFVTFILLIYSCFSFSQGFNVKEFKQNINDGSAFHAPMDANGHPCGLIKVRSDNSMLKFGGNVVGNVENKTNEYWVYMAQGSSQLQIKHPNFIPLNINFCDYGIDEITSKATYILTLSEMRYKPEKTGLTITLKPETTSLYIDDVLVDNLNGNGYYQLYLPKGDHICRFEQKGYRPTVQAITTGKGEQNLNIELESVMAELEVKCKTSTAEIYVDGEKKGTGMWKGTVFAGNHEIEARQQNHESSRQTISIAEKERRTFIIPELKRSKGKLHIGTTPTNLSVLVDGKYVGISPCVINIESGNHYVSCKAFGCVPMRKDIQIKEGEETLINIEMEYSNKRDWLVNTYKKAYGGDENAILELANTYVGWGWRENKDFYEEAVYWIERYSHSKEVMDNEAWISAYCFVGNPEKALEIYLIISKKKKEKEWTGFIDEYRMDEIGNAFFKKKEYDRAISCFLKAVEADKYDYGCGLEGLGDCYNAKGDKQKAASYYQKYLKSGDINNRRNIIEKKLKQLESK